VKKGAKLNGRHAYETREKGKVVGGEKILWEAAAVELITAKGERSQGGLLRDY